jgi:phospholipid/cholesterol/gamma-HCH transport system substrate-binding protein
MSRFTNEFKVGLLALLALLVVAVGILRTDDRPGTVTEDWLAFAEFPSVEGVYVSTPVRMAGVAIGSVEEIELLGNRARLHLSIRGDVKLPADSKATLRAAGMLGDREVKIVSGVSDAFLPAGATIESGELPPDIESITRQVSTIAEDVKAITTGVRAVTDDEQTRQELLLTIQNVRLLSEQLTQIAATNGADIAVIADNLREVSEALKQVIQSTGKDVSAEMAAIARVTETLDRTLKNIEAITAGVNAGEGTVGKLLKDTETIDSVNDTLGEVNGIVSDVTRLRTEVYYRGNYFFGSDPTSDALAENPTGGRMRNAVGVRLLPSEDHWYEIEFVGHPQGTVSYEDRSVPELGTSYREVVVAPGYRFSFQLAKRFSDLVLRFGIKESSGGFGLDYRLFRDRFQLSADLYDFTYGSYPVLDGTPNLQFTARALPWRHLYFEGGLDNVLMGAKYGYVTGYVGGGFYFDDSDLKYVLAAAPVKP